MNEDSKKYSNIEAFLKRLPAGTTIRAVNSETLTPDCSKCVFYMNEAFYAERCYHLCERRADNGEYYYVYFVLEN